MGKKILSELFWRKSTIKPLPQEQKPNEAKKMEALFTLRRLWEEKGSYADKI